VTDPRAAAEAPTTLAIHGFGLIGASVALAARRRWPAVRLVAIDTRAVLDSQLAQRVCSERIAHDDSSGRVRAFAEADITVLAAPLSVVESVLSEACHHCRLVTDCGSTKRSVLAAAKAAGAQGFVAGHPMAGRPGGGVESADAGLFDGRPWLLCPGGASAEALTRVEQFVAALGGLPTQIDAELHDRVLALTSHVPQLLASLLLVFAERDNVPAAARGPGFDSATRVAGGPLGIWADIFERNADQVAPVLEQLASELQQLAQELRSTPRGIRLANLLAEARRLRASR
jgi:prephenate dehydrogenase